MTEGWWKYAKPGDKVVCVSLPTKILNPEPHPAPLKVGRVYTIVAVIADDWFLGGVGLNVGLGRLTDDFISAARFRPVRPKSTEASMNALRAHLNTKEVPVDA